MKKFFAYSSIAIGALGAIVLIGAVIIMFFQTRLEISNERLAIREEERSSLEDRWLDAHDKEGNVTLIIEDVAIKQNKGTLKWSDSQEKNGLVYFSVDSGDTISFAKTKSDFPKDMPSYQNIFAKRSQLKFRIDI